MGGVDSAMMGRLAQRFATAIERPTLAYAASLCAVAAAAALRAAIGLIVTPIMVFHFLQLVIVSVLAARFARRAGD